MLSGGGAGSLLGSRLRDKGKSLVPPDDSCPPFGGRDLRGLHTFHFTSLQSGTAQQLTFEFPWQHLPISMVWFFFYLWD